MAKVLTLEERRDFSRIALHRPAALDVSGARCGCELLDISLRGALLRVPPRFRAEKGQACTVLVRLDEGVAHICMRGTVAHRGEDTVGIRSRELDLDSVAHLRRLLEVNLASEALLHRELTALVASCGR